MRIESLDVLRLLEAPLRCRQSHPIAVVPDPYATIAVHATFSAKPHIATHAARLCPRPRSVAVFAIMDKQRSRLAGRRLALAVRRLCRLVVVVGGVRLRGLRLRGRARLEGRARLPDLLAHAHDNAGRRVLLVLKEAGGRRQAGGLLEQGLLVVEALEDRERLLEKLLDRTLVGHRLLKLLVLLLAVLAGALHLHLHLADIGPQGVDGLRESVDGGLQTLFGIGIHVRLLESAQSNHLLEPTYMYIS